ncbi:MAG: hypothetical protein F6K00_35025 [Leptolyngbya sp. SIOISBB]|nr:hypothetical protein [Leptolyngbya sp. SIOISBB]
MSDQTSDWLDVAASKGSTQWLQQFIYTFLSRLEKGQITVQEFADEFESELASRMLDTPKRQKNYRSNVVQALKILDAEHPAIRLVTLTTDEYRRLNDEQRGRVAQRDTQYLHPDAISHMVKIAENLLDSDEWSDVGAGLAVLIGRRISEILLSKFSLKTPWSLNFSQMAKKPDDVDVTIEIPTLAPAATVLAAIEKLQSGLAIADLRQQGAASRQLKQAVNRRYSLAVAQKCDEYFSSLVPARSDKDNLYTHIFRAVYATIAAHWFCPPNVPEHQYKAEIQGHFTLTEASEKLPNYAARSNYDDYSIGDGQGNRDGRLGIQLGQLPGLEVIAAFKSPSASAPVVTEPEPVELPDSEAPEEIRDLINIEEGPIMTDTSKLTTKRPHIYADDLERLSALMAHEGVTGTTADLLHALLDECEQRRVAGEKAQIETVGEVAQTFNWFTVEIDKLRARVDELQAERDQLTAQQSSLTALSQLQAENAQLKAQLSETQSQLNGIQALLGGAQPNADVNGNVSPAPVAPAQSVAPQTVPSIHVPAAAPSPSPKTKKASRDQGGAKAKVESIIQDIINWNTAQASNDTRLRISVAVIKALGSLVGATYQPAIMEVLQEQEATIDEIHQRFMIGNRHNARVDKDRVLQSIARDYMGVPNWQEAKY